MIVIINSAGLSPVEDQLITNKSQEEIEKFIVENPWYNWNLLPTSAAVITGHLRKAGFPVVLFDHVKQVSNRLSRQLTENDFVQWLLHDKQTPLMEEYLHLAFKHLPSNLEDIKLIGISISHMHRYPYALSVAKELKTRLPNIPICLGGTYITLSHHNFPGYISFVIKGYGGGPICHLAGHFLGKSPLDLNVPGLYKNSGSEPPGNKKNQSPLELEEVPDFSSLDLKSYSTYNLHQLFFAGKPSMPYITFEYRTSMGCTNKCSFCSGREVAPLQFKSVKKIIHDLRYFASLAERFSNNQLCIILVDLALNNSLEHLNALLDGIIESRLNIRWLAYAKIHNMTERILEKFPRAGCKGLFWGIEAATPRMLKIYDKLFRPEDAERIILKAVEQKIFNILSLIYNGPGEKDEDFEGTLDFITRLSKYRPYVLIRPSEFRVVENSRIIQNPGKFNVEAFTFSKYPYSIPFPIVEWKETGSDWNMEKRKRQIREKRIRSLVGQLWGS